MNRKRLNRFLENKRRISIITLSLHDVILAFQRTMAEGDPSNTQPEKAYPTRRLAKVEFRFEHDNGTLIRFLPLAHATIYATRTILYFVVLFSGYSRRHGPQHQQHIANTRYTLNVYNENVKWSEWNFFPTGWLVTLGIGKSND